MATQTSFQPLFPEERVSAPLLELAAELIAECYKLAGQAAPPIVAALQPRLRAMNSYYTNKIEGQDTKPAAIERAIRKQFDADLEMARKQRLAVAHMEVEAELEREFAGVDPKTLFDETFVRRIHASLYGKLEEADCVSPDGKLVVPGQYRQEKVKAGLHAAPPPKDIEPLMTAWATAYRRTAGNEALLVAMACSHHRLVWVHPFIDGNGRTARLHSHAILNSMGLTRGLWSPMRGLARTHDQYYARLNNADLPRRNDLDGRGALSQEELVKFAHYFLDVCLDQVHFMRDRLALSSLKERLRVLLAELESKPWPLGSEKSLVRAAVLEPLHYVAITGELDRSRFIEMTGLGPRTGRRALASLLDYGLLAAESTRAPVSFQVPLKALNVLFPNLWPEAAIE